MERIKTKPMATIITTLYKNGRAGAIELEASGAPDKQPGKKAA